VSAADTCPDCGEILGTSEDCDHCAHRRRLVADYLAQLEASAAEREVRDERA
jgi:hypothetical protein